MKTGRCIKKIQTVKPLTKTAILAQLPSTKSQWEHVDEYSDDLARQMYGRALKPLTRELAEKLVDKKVYMLKEHEWSYALSPNQRMKHVETLFIEEIKNDGSLVSTVKDNKGFFHYHHEIELRPDGVYTTDLHGRDDTLFVFI